ncbi:TIGR02680 family protein [Paenibacillus sp. LHD-38]|uniref:TIGR02680 family protein n=1 Tax=Paenibacillus sp. LHD-38 TaxID=3072143 RepID=UPI0028105863|nr:TIGR02680 family protein [Paenibacillus sp. LHD-38]MDQ8735040.1 TIGR02680 family protein [Paenibacillus sp. LHD-38]
MVLISQMEEQTEKSATTDRWQMNRAGILNFWYYDEDEFQLEDGRLILRGSNGSGKSVTMQSFLPLVLDGDKRAHRLDPFGSRDRRIEYYLLGEDDGGKGKTDSTGYLWMEFKHTRSGAYKTIGIGLRARRNVSQVQFWGFVIEDGRRVGQQLWLYDRNRWIEDEARVPYDRKELEAIIGGGGVVVQDQKSYQDLVNKQIFGFADVDAFQDLLQLMIQLRSPKLSKDFKPSAIYDILHQALPPLVEDELRPLSEVLEDMDQMTDRLDEIRRQRSEMAKLQERYELYNKHVLYTKSEEMLADKVEYDSVAAKVSQTEAELAQAEQEKAEVEEERTVIARKLQEMTVEQSVLEQHEAIGKQKEYEAVNAALKDTETQYERSNEKLRKDRINQDRLNNELEEAQYAQAQSQREQSELLEELEGAAGDMEFTEHTIYHLYWATGVPQDDAWKEAWRNDIRCHRERVERALAKAAQEREASAMAKEREIELGEASLARDEAERDRSDKDNRLEDQKNVLKDALLFWQSRLVQLPFVSEDMSAVFSAIRQFGAEQVSFEPLRETMLTRYTNNRESLVDQRLVMEQEQKELHDRRDQLEQEKLNWEQSKEPEPARIEARARYRGRNVQSGAPLYAACDFRPHVSENLRAKIEEALERTGMLDAWITPDGKVGACEDGEEESWVIPHPIEFGYTLADLLAPNVPENSALTNEMVDHVLRSFLWDEDGSLLDEGDFNSIITGSGSYRLGVLAGHAAVKPRAEFIGKETRKRTRMLEIERLKAIIAQIDIQLQESNRLMHEQLEREKQLIADRDAYPGGQELLNALQELKEAGYRLQAAQGQEVKALERYKAKSEECRLLQRELHDLTTNWTRLKREKELSEAIHVIRDYESALSDIFSAWRQFMDTQAAALRMQEQLQTIRLEMEDEEDFADVLDARRRDQRAKSEALRRVIEELGLADVARRLNEIREESEICRNRDKQRARALDDLKDQVSRADARLMLLQEQADGLQIQLQKTLEGLQLELGRGLVKEWREKLVSNPITESSKPVSAQEPFQLIAKQIKLEYESLFSRRKDENVSNALLMQFNAARMLLTEFVLQTVLDELTGRILVVSMRNPHQPLPPQVILEELEEQEKEQGALLSERDRELYEDIILRSVGKAIRQRIHRAEQWIREMNKLMEARDTSSGLRLKLEWGPKAASGEQQLDTSELVELLKRDSQRLREDEIEAMIHHFRSQVQGAKQSAIDEKESLRLHLYSVLDYRNWFQFELKYKKGEQTGYRPLTDARFNVMSGGEKAMAMYIPLFAATSSRYSDARHDAPRLISLDEAFAGVDEENMRDMFKLLTDMGFDYMMTSQVLWGCYDTVPMLAIYEIYRPKDVDFVTLFRYRWNGKRKEYVEGNNTVV